MPHIEISALHPQLRLTGALYRALLPYFDEDVFRAAARIAQPLRGLPPRGMTLTQHRLPRPDGSALRLCVYRPRGRRAPGPGLLWLHGGGCAIGLPELETGFIRLFVREGCTVVAPDYTLSVRAPWPAAAEDCYAALLWMRKNADDLSIRPEQLMVGGDSAGGGLTAAVTILARQRGEAAIAFQMPLYPMLDDRMLWPSAQGNDAPVWNTRSNENAWRLYLGPLYGGSDVPTEAAPGRLTDFTGLPPAFTFVGGAEPFLDETLAYFAQLRAAGVAAECRVFDGCYHAFDVMAPGSAPAREARALLRERFRYAAAHYFAPQPE